MRFHLAEPVFGLPVRLVSEGGVWETGYTPATFDRWQVTLGKAGSTGVEVRYCCGEDDALRLEVLLLVLSILAPLDEYALTYPDVRRIFPKWTRRPIDRDPTCLHELRRLAAGASV